MCLKFVASRAVNGVHQGFSLVATVCFAPATPASKALCSQGMLVCCARCRVAFQCCQCCMRCEWQCTPPLAVANLHGMCMVVPTTGSVCMECE